MTDQSNPVPPCPWCGAEELPGDDPRKHDYACGSFIVGDLRIQGITCRDRVIALSAHIIKDMRESYEKMNDDREMLARKDAARIANRNATIRRLLADNATLRRLLRDVCEGRVAVGFGLAFLAKTEETKSQPSAGPGSN